MGICIPAGLRRRWFGCGAALVIAMAVVVTAGCSPGAGQPADTSNPGDTGATGNDGTTGDTGSTVDTSGEGLPAAGTISVPAGSTLRLSDLKVMTAAGKASVGADGTFTAKEPVGGPAMVVAMDADGKLIMLGHIDADNPSFNDISPMSTAEELLFLATTAFTLPIEQWPHVYELLAAAPETATLAAVIAQRIAVNVTALDDQDPEILAALQTARDSLVAAIPGVGIERLRQAGPPRSALLTPGRSWRTTQSRAQPR